MFCTNCGSPNKDETKFCVKCGQSFGETSGEEKSSQPKILKDELSEKGADFFKILFDFTFTDFVTSKIIKLLYGLSIACSALMALILIIIGFSGHVGLGVVTLLIFAPLIFLISVIYSRVLLEIVIVIFRIAENTADMSKKMGAES